MPIEAFRNQKYNLLKKELIKEAKLFTDVEFPPCDSSLYIGNNCLVEGVEWKRPGDIVANPRLFVEGVSYNDVTQGILGNCWFVAACSALTHHKTLWSKVIPDASDQEWDPNKPYNYCGIFHFSFWRFGHWVDVVVDDLLPTKNNELIFARSSTLNEFWSALLEKAFAKLNGCYESLSGGTLTEAFVDITGGVPETISLSLPKYCEDITSRTELFHYLKEAFDSKALIAAAIAAKSPSEIEEQLECGLVKGHSYAISAIKRLALDANYAGLLSQLFSQPEKIMMVRLQNPWGEKEWNGPWSDDSPEWRLISKQQQHDLGLKIEEDGQFWMTWDDFCRHFTDISVCHQINTSFFSLGKRYIETTFQGVWMSGQMRGRLDDRAGGCANFKESCLCNPQLRFDLSEDNTELQITLMQRDIRERRRLGAAYLTIGIMIQRVEENRTFRMHQLLDMAATSDYVNTRSVFLRLTHLKKGRYVIIPTTYAPGEEGEFMLRMYSTIQLNTKELIKDQPSGGLWSCFRSRFSCVSRLRLIGVEGLKSAGDTYCIVKCEGTQYRTATVKDSSSPTWDVLLIFLRRNCSKCITIDVFASNILKDSFLGRAMLSCPVNNDVKCEQLALKDRKKNSGSDNASLTGKVRVEVATYDNPIYL